jgi:putative transposase
VKKSRFAEEQIAFALKQAELGTKVDEICRKLRMLTVVDCYSRESLAIHVGQSLKGEDVVQVLNGIAAQRGRPQVIKSDNGSEFIGKAMDKWAYEHRVALDFSRPGRPTDNAMVESFNGRLRQECLNEHWFMSLADARTKIEAWRRHYNESRPHSALDWMTPLEFARCSGPRPAASADKEPENPTFER